MARVLRLAAAPNGSQAILDVLGLEEVSVNDEALLQSIFCLQLEAKEIRTAEDISSSSMISCI